MELDITMDLTVEVDSNGNITAAKHWLSAFDEWIDVLSRIRGNVRIEAMVRKAVETKLYINEKESQSDQD